MERGIEFCAFRIILYGKAFIVRCIKENIGHMMALDAVKHQATSKYLCRSQ